MEEPLMSKNKLVVLTVCTLLVPFATASAQMHMDTAETPPQLVATYESLADTILGAKHTEWNLVHSILATTYGHAASTVEQAKAKMQAGKSARAKVETLAKLVAQIGNEGDASVAAVRKRLLEGGHHHHSSGEQQGVYEEGFVIVTRVARKSFLDSAAAIGKLSAGTDAAKLETEWKKVQTTFNDLHKGVK